MKIEKYMKTDVISIVDTATIFEAVMLFVNHHIGTLPVVDETMKLIGILQMRDVLKLVMPSFVDIVKEFNFVKDDFGAFEDQKPTKETESQPVKNIMEPPVSVTTNSGLIRAYAIINRYNLYDLPIVNEEGRLVGIASLVDIGTAILSKWRTMV